MSFGLPHRPPALRLVSVDERTAEACVCTARAPASGAWWIEVCAQAAGVLLGSSLDEAGARSGVLVGVRRFRIDGAVAPDTLVRIDVTRRALLGDQALFRCRVSTDEETIASGDLAVALT